MLNRGIRQEYILNDKLIIGRKTKDLKNFQDRLIGYVGDVWEPDSRESTSVSIKVYLDFLSPHVCVICGKKGYGKSYSMGVILEEFLRLEDMERERLSMIVIDTMGIFWSLRHSNIDRDELAQLESRYLRPHAFSEVDIVIPKKFAAVYDQSGLEYTKVITLNPGDLEDVEWCYAFGIDYNSPMGIALSNLITSLKDDYGDVYTIDAMLTYVSGFDDEKLAGANKHADSAASLTPKQTKSALTRRLMFAKDWGVFYEKGDSEFTKVTDLIRPGKVSVVNISDYRSEMASGWGVRSLVTGIIAKKIYELRSRERRLEQAHEVKEVTTSGKGDVPLVWMLIDEAHRFAPSNETTAASRPLIEWARQGRHPGLSLVLATQRPGSLDSDILSQCDLVMSHRLTSKPDIDALSRIQPSYSADLKESLEKLPSDRSGYALVIDDTSEQYFYVKTRERLSWHAGDDAKAVKEGPNEN